MVHIRVKDLSKRFNLDRKRNEKLISNRRKHTAVDKVSFEVREGECVGIVGKNGSGKTTLLKLLAGILEPDAGTIEVDGRILALIDLQAGMADELTGRENIFQKGIVHGLTRKEVRAKLDKIIRFSGLEDFIDVKLKKYSAGMKMRLAFSIAMEVPHDIILLDEIAGVGDDEFQKKSMARLNELKLEGKTFVVVSHQMDGQIKECDRVIFLDEGKIVADGPPEETVQLYLGHMVEHHLADMKEEVERRLGELESLKPSTRENQQEKKSKVWGAVGGLFNRLKENRTPESRYEEMEAELKSRVREFQELADRRRYYLEGELPHLRELLYKQKEYNKGQAPNLEAEEKYLLEFSKRKEEFRQLLDWQQFLLDVKIRLGYKPLEVQTDQRIIKGAIKCLIENKPEEIVKDDSKTLNERYLNVMEQELAENPSMKKALLIIRDYASTYREILKSESDTKARARVLERFLNLLEDRFKGSAQEELWVVERLLEVTGSVFDTDAFHILEYPFLLRYIQMARRALLTAAPQPAIRKKIDELGHLLRGAIHSAECELLNLSLNQDKISSKDSKRKAALLEAKQQLFNSLSELYASFRTRPIKTGKEWGFGDAEITRVSLYSPEGKESQSFKTGESMRIMIRYVLQKKLTTGILVGLTIHHENGLPLFVPHTIITEKERLEPGVENTVQFVLNSLPLTSGRYPLSVAIYDPLVTVPYDHHHQAFEFQVVGKDGLGNQGILDLEHTWQIGLAKNRPVQ